MLAPQGIILNENDLRRAVSYFMTKPAYAFDVETSFDNRLVCHLNTVSWISLATEGCAIVIPMLHPLGKKTGTTTVATEYKSGKKAGTFYNKTIDVFDQPPAQLTPDVVFSILKPLFASNKIKIGHNLLFDLCSVAKYLGFVPPPPYHCSLVAARLIDDNRRGRYGLKRVIDDTYGVKYDEGDFGKKVEIHPFEDIAYYAYSDAKWCYLLYKRQVEHIAEEKLNSIFKLEMNVLNTLTGMRLKGIRVDVPALKDLKIELEPKLIEAEGLVYKAAGHKFNVNSPAQKQVVLFEEQGLKPVRPTKSGLELKKSGQPLLLKHWSTNKDALLGFHGNEVARSLLQYGEVSKLLSGFVNPWLSTEDIPSKVFNDHIHASFNQAGTETGRFSCSSPNIQQIPSAKGLGKKVKDLFIPEPGHTLIDADYSQMELVILAHYIGQGTLYDAILNGDDVHRIAAAGIFGKSPEEVSTVERSLGKKINFTVCYGGGPFRVSVATGKPLSESKVFLKRHEETFPEIYACKESLFELARENKPVPYITTLLGRKRRVPGLNSRDFKIRGGAEREIFNSLIQGSLADLIKLAMVRLDSMLPDDAAILVTLHDELLISYPEDRLDEGKAILREAMTGPGIQKYLNLEMKITLNSGNAWGSIEK